MTTNTRALTGPRASSLAMCERRTVYEYLDAEREETSAHQERLFARGRRLGRMLAEEIAEHQRALGMEVELEREIPWGLPGQEPVGVGHADLFIVNDAQTIEIVSTAGAELPPHKVRQVALYSHFDPASTSAGVVSLDPSTNEERFYPVDVDSFRPDIEAAVERAVRGMRTGDPGVARRALDRNGEQVESPSDWPCFDCPFRRGCWADFEQEPVGVLPDELHATVRELAAVEDKLAAVKAAPQLEERRNELRAKLAGRMIPGAVYRIPGFEKVRRTEVAGRRTFSLKAFEDAGHQLPPEASAFMRTGDGHDRWTITRAQAS